MKHGDTIIVADEELECLYCGTYAEEGEMFFYHQPYNHEPSAWVCENCKENN